MLQTPDLSESIAASRLTKPFVPRRNTMKARWTARTSAPVVAILLVLALVVAACGGTAAPAPTPTMSPPTAALEPTAAPQPMPTEAAMVDMGSLVFFSTQFVPVEEAEKFRAEGRRHGQHDRRSGRPLSKP